MKKKYYLIDASGKVKIFSSFNALLRALKVSDAKELAIADVLGTIAFTGKDARSYEDPELGIKIEYR